jgi:hypothetical protein
LNSHLEEECFAGVRSKFSFDRRAIHIENKLLLLGNCFFNPNIRTPRIVPGRRGCNQLKPKRNKGYLMGTTSEAELEAELTAEEEELREVMGYVLEEEEEEGGKAARKRHNHLFK